jgi:hypothetical protein
MSPGLQEQHTLKRCQMGERRGVWKTLIKNDDGGKKQEAPGERTLDERSLVAYVTAMYLAMLNTACWLFLVSDKGTCYCM